MNNFTEETLSNDIGLMYDTCIEEIRDVINKKKDALSNSDINLTHNFEFKFTVDKYKDIQAIVGYSKRLDWYCEIYGKNYNKCLLVIKNNKDKMLKSFTSNELIDITARFIYEFDDVFDDALQEFKKDLEKDVIISFMKENLYNKIAKKDKEDDYELENS